MKTVCFKKYSKLVVIFLIFFYYFFIFQVSTFVLASGTSTFNQTINAGTLSIDIADSTSSYASVSSPAITMGALTFSFSCQQATGTFGTATEAIYIQNPDAADSGWTVSLAAASTTDVWDSAGTDFDFNDPGTGGCVDDGPTTDTDGFGGQMTVVAEGASLGTGGCSSCGVSNITVGSSAAYVEGSTDTVTLLTAAAGSDDIGDWDLTGVTINQQVPAEQPAASDYSIDMVLSVTAS